jgi:mercuric ion binding protein
MKKYLLLATIAAALGLGALATLVPFQSAARSAAESVAQHGAHTQTASFAIDNMTCATCPITVRTAMSRVAGVRSVEVDFATKRATVTYDTTVATPHAIAAASTNAGYPARLVDGASS